MVKALFVLVILAIIVLPLGGWWMAQMPLPPQEGVISIRELAEPVTVRFDGRAVPFVEARSEADLYMAQGYLCARDRMFQMDMLRRLATGELSAVYGPSMMPADKLMRTVGLMRQADLEVTLLPPEVRAGLDAYCRGVNIYLLDYLQKLPLEFRLLGYIPRAWEPRDSLAVMRYVAYTLDESWTLDDLRQRVLDKTGADIFMQLFRDDWSSTPALSAAGGHHLAGPLKAQLQQLGAVERMIFTPRPTLGSNAWVVAGTHSDSRGALLACDKHANFSSPDLMYLMGLAAPQLQLAGATIPGVPGVAIGRNADIGWGAASLKADVQDLFVEEFSPNLPNQYKTPTGWQAASERSEVIPVRFAKDMVHKVTETRHGPVLFRHGNTGVALAWTGSTVEKSPLTALWKVNRAKGWDDFQAALQDYPGSPQVFVFADSAGNVGYQAAGDIPIRSRNGEGTLVVPGWVGAGDWTARVPFAELPHGLSPPQGFAVAANQKVLSANPKVLIGHQWCPPYRAARAFDLLRQVQNQGRRAGLPDMNDLQADSYAYLSGLVKKEIHDSISQTELIDRIQLNAMDLLDHWDGSMRVDSPAATIFESFMQTLARRLVEPKVGKAITDEYLDRFALWPTFVERYLREKPPAWLPPEERTHSAFMVTTFSQAIKDLRLQFRNDDPAKWLWSGAHLATFHHGATKALPWLSPLIDLGPVGVNGNTDTMNACDVVTGGAGRLTSATGPTMRLILDMSDHDKFYAGTSLGQSGQFFSPHRKDELRSWLRADPMPLAFSPSQAERLTQHKLMLTNRPPVQAD